MILLQIRVEADLENYGATVAVYATIPILGRIQLVSVSGNLKDGIKAGFNVAFASGFVKVFIENNILKAEVNASVLGITFDEVFELFVLK